MGDDKFEMPIPAGSTDDVLGADEKMLFDQTERSHLDWLRRQVQRKVPEEMLVAILVRAACGGGIACGFTKEKFMALVDKTFDVVWKMPARSLARR